jgi:hypothetical protein
MSSKITNVIPQQNFELIATKIATILLAEFQNQLILLPANTVFAIDKIWIERFIPFDKTELPAVNVFYSNSNYTDNDVFNSLGDAIFSIEVITNAKHTTSTNADVLASKKLQRLMGAIRYILEHPAYLNLDLQKFVFNTKIESIRAQQPQQQGDGLHTISGLINFTVKLRENNGAQNGILLDFTGTQFRVDNTNKGYFIYLEN